MIKNNLAEILAKLEDEIVRNQILKKNLINLSESKKNFLTKPFERKYISEITEVKNSNPGINKFEKPPNLQEDRSFNLLEFDDFFENSNNINKKHNEDQVKQIKSEESNNFEFDNIDISELINDQLEYEKQNENKKNEKEFITKQEIVELNTYNFSSRNYDNNDYTNHKNFTSNNFQNYVSNDNFNRGNNNKKLSHNQSNDNNFIGNFEYEKIGNVKSNFKEGVYDDANANNKMSNFDIEDYEIDSIEDKKCLYTNKNTNEMNVVSDNKDDGYVQDGDFEKIENKNYKLANLNEWKSSEFDDMVDSANRHLFGFQFFRPNQREIINACLNNRDTFVCMPTGTFIINLGGGKSLTFQIPGVIKEGVSIVVMPLLSLIQDQVSILTGLGIKVLNLKGEGQLEAERNFHDYFLSREDETDKVKFIFITPEKFSKSPSTLKLLNNLYEYNLISRFVIDEAHCLSQWGREFRPDYMDLRFLRKRFPRVPISAITATATNKVRDDIINTLGLKECLFFRSSYNRHNLYLEVRDKKNIVNPITDIYEFIKEHNYMNKTGIIYCSSKKECENVNKKLKELSLLSEFYHASMPETKRISIQEKWKNDEVRIIVATIAFGMGINKNDVRYVIHYNMPKSFENYYQEIGRAGRDGNHSHCLLYYQINDRKIMEFLLGNQHLNLEMNKLNLRKINEVQEFCEELIECRRILALKYFGENFKRENCNKQCDNCKKSLAKEEIDLTDYAYKICEVVRFCQYSNEKITFLSLSDFLRGTGAGKFKKKQNKLLCSNYFGYIKELSSDLIKRLIRRLIIEKLLYENIVTNMYGTNCYVFLDDFGGFFLKNRGDKKFVLVVPESKNKKIFTDDLAEEIEEQIDISNLDEYKYKEVPKEKKPRKRFVKTVVDLDNRQEEEKEKTNDYKEDYGFCLNKQKFEELFDILKKKRNEIFRLEKDKSNKPDNQTTADALFPTNGLMELCRKLPDKKSDLNSNYIFGVASEKLTIYGEHFLPEIQKFIKLNKIVKNDDLIQKYASEKKERENHSSKKKSYIISSQKKEKENSLLKQMKFKEREEEKEINEIRERYLSSSIDIKRDNDTKKSEVQNPNVEEIMLYNEENIFGLDEFNVFEQQKEISDEEDVKPHNQENFDIFAKEAKNLNKENAKRKKEESDDEDPVGGKKGKKGGGKNNYFKNKMKWKKINEYRRKKKG